MLHVIVILEKIRENAIAKTSHFHSNNCISRRRYQCSDASHQLAVMKISKTYSSLRLLELQRYEEIEEVDDEPKNNGLPPRQP